MAIQEVDLPITGYPYRNVDEAELDKMNALVMDSYIDEFGHTQKRPCPGEELCDLGTSQGVDGLFWWDTEQILMAVSQGRVWKITDRTGTMTELTGATLNTGTRVSFAPNGSKMVMANGGNMIHTVAGGPLTVMADGDAPTAVTHVAFLDGYTLANSVGSQTFQWSAINDATNWNAGDQAQANGAPDNLEGLYVGTREILLGGPNSVEIWYNDGSSPFSRLQGGFIQRGIGAPHTVKQVNDRWMYLDEERHFVKVMNRTPTIVSMPYNKLIQSFPSVNDAVADVMNIDGLPLYVVSFPSGGKTFVYDYIADGWTDWGYWDLGTATYGRFRGQCYAYAKPWNLHLVGDPYSGKIYKISRSYFTDNGNPCRTLRRTGFISHGTTKDKFSRELIVTLKRGLGNSRVSEPKMFVRWRNDGGQWGNEHWVSLGKVGDHYYQARLRRLGKYRTRQWEFGHTDDSDFILVGAKEFVEMGLH